MRDKTHILIVDDQALFADSLKSVIGFRASDFHVVGVAADGEAAIELARREKPDIVLMDIRMPGLDGVRATKLIHAEFPDIKIIVLTSFDDDEYIFDALSHGAMGYILKDIPVNELISSLRAVRDGTISMSPSVARKVVGRGHSGVETAGRAAEPGAAVPGAAAAGTGPAGLGAAPGTAPAASPDPAAPPEWLAGLGRREREILGLIAQGRDNAQIAEKLFISEQTVKNYVYGLYVKLGEHNRPRVMQMAMRNAAFLGKI
ncbi:MAG TPA: response regulator transcription factor [Rectinemataceae bacterium]|nr:response regulator transcription factor [Rectinemataceae bacterium]